MAKSLKPKVKDGTVPLNVRIPEGLDRALEEHCRMKSISKANAVRVAIHNYLDDYHQKPIEAGARSELVEAVASLERAGQVVTEGMRAIATFANVMKRKP